MINRRGFLKKCSLIPFVGSLMAVAKTGEPMGNLTGCKGIPEEIIFVTSGSRCKIEFEDIIRSEAEYEEMIKAILEKEKFPNELISL